VDDDLDHRRGGWRDRRGHSPLIAPAFGHRIVDSMAVASFRSIRNAAAAAIGADAQPIEELVDAPELRELSLGSEPAARLRDALLDDTRFLEDRSGTPGTFDVARLRALLDLP
jgi:hypothetical protein